MCLPCAGDLKRGCDLTHLVEAEFSHEPQIPWLGVFGRIGRDSDTRFLTGLLLARGFARWQGMSFGFVPVWLAVILNCCQAVTVGELPLKREWVEWAFHVVCPSFLPSFLPPSLAPSLPPSLPSFLPSYRSSSTPPFLPYKGIEPHSSRLPIMFNTGEEIPLVQLVFQLAPLHNKTGARKRRQSHIWGC